MSVVAKRTRAPGLFAQGIAKAIESASESEVRRALFQMLACDKRAFCRSAGGLLLREDLPGSRYLVQFLLRHKLLIESLASADDYDPAHALALVRGAAKIGPLLEEELGQALSAALQQAPSTANGIRILRTLELMAAAVAPGSLLALQHELMAYADPKVRSKAALLTGRGAKSSASIGRLLRDEDARVQANSVEALWSLDAGASGALLQMASKSSHNRVRGNALVGLYGISDAGSISGIFEMAEHQDARFRATAYWAMGVTGDSRFVPFLTNQLNRNAGSERLSILKALTRIRKREKIFAEAGAIDILVSGASVEPDGNRRLALALRTQGAGDLSSIPATRLAIWEGATLIRNYKVLVAHNPALLIAGIVAPCVRCGDGFASAAVEALTRCLRWKRPDDLWRIDRYASGGTASPSPADASRASREEGPADPQKKAHNGFLSSAEQLGALLSDPATSAPASGALEALEKAAEAIRRLSGARHMFVFFHPDSANEWVNEQRRVEQLSAMLRDEHIVLHGIAPDSGGDASVFQELCLAAKSGTFNACNLDAIPETVDQMYSQLLNRYEISYHSAPGCGEPCGGKLVVSSERGCGQASYVLTKRQSNTP